MKTRTDPLRRILTLRNNGLTALLLVLAGGACGQSDILQPAGSAPNPQYARFGKPDVVVRPGESIQAALDAANPGDVIHIEAGTYRESVSINKPGIKIVGLGVVILENPGGAANGISVGSAGDDFALINFTVRGFERNGVFLVGVDGFFLSEIVAENDGRYGIFPVRSSKGVIERSSATGHNDTGIYVGQSTDVQIRHNQVFGNVNGIEIENSSDIKAIANDAYDNVAGFLVVLLPGLQMKTSSTILLAGNRVHDNNRANFAEPGTLESFVPSGSGMLVVGTDHTIVENNTVSGNRFVGIAVGSSLLLGALAGLPPEAFADIEPHPDGARILSNRATGNGQHSDIPFLPPADLLWDGSGTDNCWARNTFTTSVPDPLPSCSGQRSGLGT
jgi:parallel beta-helix repeat protein